ncbi:cyclic nucleotide-binding domain-containing protein [uncultured Ramlibacter sp.]|uniref:cyclic nucleotide-binding domain-containing protein n=1 Tax=uncultured Ramlibacter sp. TaxID=260755 RepID=UPI0026382759|nr:cyclic nucleotide-binding domain-containing protein [uncultured Ramlibacter sp.]
MSDVLALCGGLPQQHVAAGTPLIQEGGRTDRLYILRSGSFEVVRNGVRVIVISEPGAFLGEISVLLQSPPTADVVATMDSTVHVLEQAGTKVRQDPELTHAIAQLLARRLLAVTAYLVDIKRQYAGTDSHLALMDQVLARLMDMQPAGARPGSERGDVPDY